MKWIALALLAAALLALLWSRPDAPPSPGPDADAWVRAFLEQGPACYRWTEEIGGEPIPHAGGLVFVLDGQTVRSRAWFGSAEFAQPWPPVEGAGTLEGETLHIAYRSAGGDPAHAFYHAHCRFTFRRTDKSFRCTFLQRADPDGENELSPGAARGAFVADPAQDYREHMAALDEKKESADALPCPVLPNAEARPEISFEHAGKKYTFCCTSCRTVFEMRPEAFIERRGRD